MSTDDSTPSPGSFSSEPITAFPPAATGVPGATPEAPGATPAAGGEAPTDEPDTSFFARHAALITAAMVAVIVAAVALVGVWLYRDNVDDHNAATEAAFTRSVEDQGATIDTVECDGNTCAAIISGQAYSVLVQDDKNGKQHFGVSAYAGN
jgi:hypothetical protein